MEQPAAPGGSIKPIDSSSIHRICSGQVILDLSTAVKELIENALDAKATNVEVRLKEYGSQLIEVADNGMGVAADDYQALTLKYHTSKINDFSDLDGLSTFGFRGEALSSLCAVADGVSVITRTAQQEAGVRLEFDRSGKLTSTTDAPRAVGTTVAVRELFRPLPVRHREFLKSVKREFAKLVTVLQAYALVSTTTRLLATNQAGQTAARTTVLSSAGQGCSVRDNIVMVFGTKAADALLPLRHEAPAGSRAEGVTISGYVSRPGMGLKSDTSRQFFYINGRPVDLPRAAKALNDAFRSLSSAANSASRPMAILDFALPPASFDVNLTPDKRKVLLHQEAALLEELVSALQKLWEPSRHTYTVHQPIGQPRNTAALVTGQRQQANLPPAVGAAAAAAAAAAAVAAAGAGSPGRQKRQRAMQGDEEQEAAADEEDAQGSDGGPQGVAAGGVGVDGGEEQPDDDVAMAAEAQEGCQPGEPTSFKRRRLQGAEDLDDQDKGSEEDVQPSGQQRDRLDAQPVADDDTGAGSGGSRGGGGGLRSLGALFGGAATWRITRVVQPDLAPAAAGGGRHDVVDDSKGSQEAWREQAPAGGSSGASRLAQAMAALTGKRTQTTLAGFLQRSSSGFDGSGSAGSRREEEAEEQPAVSPAAPLSPQEDELLGDGGDEAGVSPELSQQRPVHKVRWSEQVEVRQLAAVDDDDDDGGEEGADGAGGAGGEAQRSRQSSQQPVAAVAAAAAAAVAEDGNAAADAMDIDLTGDEQEQDLCTAGGTSRVALPAPTAPPQQVLHVDMDWLSRVTAARVAALQQERRKKEAKADADAAAAAAAFAAKAAADAAAPAAPEEEEEEEGDGEQAGRGRRRSARRKSRFASSSLQDAGSGELADASATPGAGGASAAADSELERVFNKADFLKMQVIGQFNLGFILGRLGSDLFIVDQHAADEKFNFERLTASVALNKQPLLRPLPLNLPMQDELIIREHLHLFKQNGFDFVDRPLPTRAGAAAAAKPDDDDSADGAGGGGNEQPGGTDDGDVAAAPTQLMLSAVPYSKDTLLGVDDVVEMVAMIRAGQHLSLGASAAAAAAAPTATAGGASSGDKPTASTLLRPSRVRAMLASRACRYSIMIGKPLDAGRMRRVLDNLSTLHSPWNCPHGRPTMRHVCVLPSASAAGGSE